MSDSDSNSESEKKVKVEDNVDSITVVDPDDYRKTKKLQAIEKAKEEYKELIINEHQAYQTFKESWMNPKEVLEHKKVEFLSMYGSELIPLIEDGLEKGALSEDDLKFSVHGRLRSTADELDVRYIVENQGIVLVNEDSKPLDQVNQREVYRQLERIERKLGLGLDLEENKGPAEI